MKTVAETRVTMSKVMEPTDANFLGKVFGGSILSLLDLVAYATASRFAGNICVTASIDQVDFHEPIDVGDLVICEGTVTYVGRTSIEVTIEVYAENIFEGNRRNTNTARITTVAVKDGKPVVVPRLAYVTSDDKRRFLEGKLRREMRVAHREDFAKLAQVLHDASEAELDKFFESDELIPELS